MPVYSSYSDYPHDLAAAEWLEGAQNHSDDAVSQDIPQLYALLSIAHSLVALVVLVKAIADKEAR